jgi:hypothetical protein
MPKQTKSTVVAEAADNVSDNSSEHSHVSDVEESDEIDKYVTTESFSLKNFFLKPIDEKLSNKSQYLAFPKYSYGKKQDDSLIIVSEPIKLTKGGIPKLDGEFKKTDNDRMFFWLGCDTTQKACVDLFSVLQQIDEEYSEAITNNSKTNTVYTQSKDGKKELITSLEYVPLVRESGNGEEKSKSDKQYEIYNRIKVRFNTKYDKDRAEGQASEIITNLFLLDKEEPEQLNTVSYFEKVFRWNCEARFVLMVNKFWAMRSAKNKKRECGFSIKCMQIYITKEAPSTGASGNDKFKKRLFTSPPTTKTSSTSAVKETVVSKKVEESSDSEDSDDDTSAEQEQQVKTTTKKDETSEEASESSSTEESDDSEDESPAPPPKKETTGKAKQQKKASTEESSESEESPAPPSKKGKAKSK